MVRKNIFELINEKYDIEKEFNKIVTLFNMPTVIGLSYNSPSAYTIENFINNFLLHQWKRRGSCLSCEEIKSNIITVDDAINNDKIITNLEYIVNLINLIQIKHSLNAFSYDFTREFFMLIQNIDILLDYLNHKKLIFKEEEKVILIPKNAAATSVAEISSEDTALAILMYNHASLKGNLDQKQNLLLKIYLEYENLFKKGIEGYSEFFSKTRGLVNKLNIKHNNDKEIQDIDNEKLEEWYDELYQLLLFCVLIKDNIKRKDKAEKFLKSLK